LLQWTFIFALKTNDHWPDGVKYHQCPTVDKGGGTMGSGIKVSRK